MKDAVTMADRSCWDQSFVDSGGRCHSCAERLVDDVFDLPKNNSSSWLEGLISADTTRGGFVRKSSSCSGGQFWTSTLNEDDDERLSGSCTVLPPTIRCSSPSSSGLDSGRASTSDDRIYQNGTVTAAGDCHSSSTWPPPDTGCCSDLSPGSNDLILLDSGAFSESSSGSSSGLRTAPDAAPTDGCASASHSTRISSDEAQSWVTSTAAGAAYSRVASFVPEWDVERLESAYRVLSTCGFYYGRMSMDEATERLSRWPVGTFLLRDSSDRRYLFSVSVKTCRGTTSIRMSYDAGLFRLDCRAEQEHLMPTFDCPLRLVTHYVRLCSARRTRGGPHATSTDADDGGRRNRHSYVLLESSGRRDTPVLLMQPCRDRAPSLAHVCRRTIHRTLHRGGCGGDSGRDGAGTGGVDRLQLQPSLKHYLKQYPFGL